MIRLSVLVPSIRPQNLNKLYGSIIASCPDRPFEMIVASPIECPYPLKKVFTQNIKWIQSFRSPNCCQQEALLRAEGQYICAGSDDGEFLPDALEYAISMAEERTIIVGKYLEGDNPHPDMNKEAYYKFGYHKSYQLKGWCANNLTGEIVPCFNVFSS